MPEPSLVYALGCLLPLSQQKETAKNKVGVGSRIGHWSEPKLHLFSGFSASTGYRKLE